MFCAMLTQTEIKLPGWKVGGTKPATLIGIFVVCPGTIGVAVVLLKTRLFGVAMVASS